MTALALLLGAGLGGSLVLLGTGLRPAPPGSARRRRWPDLRRRLLRAGIAGSVALVLTRWPVVAAGAALLGFFSADVLGARAAREQALARTEAIASWTEMLRDTMVAAHGLEEAVEVTASISPTPIRAEVLALAAQARRGILGQALDDFGAALDHP
ncbi:MAG: type II secretion system F family protein, partial [Gemmatimonadota bacterium]